MFLGFLFYDLFGRRVLMEELSFAKIIREPQNIHEDADIDIMNDNYNALKDIIDRFVFSEYPQHPDLFSLLFADQNFINTLNFHLQIYGITVPEKVVFTEYSEEDKQRLIEMGIVKQNFANSHNILVIHTFNKNVCFINLFLNN